MPEFQLPSRAGIPKETKAEVQSPASSFSNLWRQKLGKKWEGPFLGPELQLICPFWCGRPFRDGSWASITNQGNVPQRCGVEVLQGLHPPPYIPPRAER